MTQFFVGPTEDGSLYLEWKFADGHEVGFFLEEEMLPKTIAMTMPNREIPVSRVSITNAYKLAAILRGDA